MRSILTGLLILASAAPALADKSCKEQVDAAFAKLREAKSFRLETTISNAEGTLKMSADYVLPDRMHQKVVLGKDGLPMEMIVIGKQAWSNQGSGWVALSEAFATTVANQVRETVAEAPKGMTDYKCAGDKEFEGKTYAVYQGVLPSLLPADAKDKGPRMSAVSVPNQQTVYVDKATGLPVRNIVAPVTEPDKRLFDGTFVVGENIAIEAPKVSSN
ncbi:hypothetical protein [Hyphomicrobium facile]|uniref:Outer membrane lipoprotein-sorting protein n=1 Tax=Hyphomicrobium facile TaxID=51670 RepID=A0A1I7NH83_9HYPH|nr:hypothetical protein [Hyphomicrobium facile]SFV34021.1 hypothetical protein SAMN04488557_2189 [Hyphomicrobium facile]